MVRDLAVSFCLALLPLTLAARQKPSETPFTTTAFAQPPMQWRPIPLWFWNNTQVDADTLELQLRQMVEADGYGGCAILPFGQHFRPHPARFVEQPTAAMLAAALDACLPQRDVTFIGDEHPFNYLHKVVDGHDIYYFGNIDGTPATNTIRLRTSAKTFSLMNPHTGKVTTLPSATTNDSGSDCFEFELQLPPCQSVFLVN